MYNRILFYPIALVITIIISENLAAQKKVFNTLAEQMLLNTFRKKEVDLNQALEKKIHEASGQLSTFYGDLNELGLKNNIALMSEGQRQVIIEPIIREHLEDKHKLALEKKRHLIHLKMQKHIDPDLFYTSIDAQEKLSALVAKMDNEIQKIQQPLIGLFNNLALDQHRDDLIKANQEAKLLIKAVEYVAMDESALLQQMQNNKDKEAHEKIITTYSDNIKRLLEQYKKGIEEIIETYVNQAQSNKLEKKLNRYKKIMSFIEKALKKNKKSQT